MVTPVEPNAVNTRINHKLYDFGTHLEETTIKETMFPIDAPQPIGNSWTEKPREMIKQFETKTPNYSIERPKVDASMLHDGQFKKGGNK